MGNCPHQQCGGSEETEDVSLKKSGASPQVRHFQQPLTRLGLGRASLPFSKLRLKIFSFLIELICNLEDLLRSVVGCKT